MPGCLFLDLEEGCKLTGCTCNFEGGCEDYLPRDTEEAPEKEYNYGRWGEVTLRCYPTYSTVDVADEHFSPYYFKSRGEAFKFAKERKMLIQDYGRVSCTCPECQTEFAERELPITDVESDDLGRDNVYWNCPVCKKDVVSLRRGS